MSCDKLKSRRLKKDDIEEQMCRELLNYFSINFGTDF
jgi:hypothetical protein